MTRLIAASVWAFVTLFGSDSFAAAPNRRASRPSAHASLGATASPTTSWMERSITWPGGSINPRLSFTYRVDSEEGWDFLQAYVDGNLVFQRSGKDQAGRFTTPVSAGTHTVRFQYLKDTSVDRGRDTASVDNVVATTDTGVLFDSDFQDRTLDAPDGWSTGGYGGGWVISFEPAEGGMARPAVHSHLGYQPTSSNSWMERIAVWPSDGSLEVRALVDSELNYDHFRISIDGGVVYEISGRHTVNKSVPVSAGAHSVHFEYSKDTSVDAGLDVARVTEVQYRSGDTTFELETFDGLPPGQVPYPWYVGGTFGGWGASRAAPPRVYLKESASAPPAIDGTVQTESLLIRPWKDATTINLPDFGDAQFPAAFGSFLRPPGDDLYLAAELPTRTMGAGDEGVYFTLVLDSNHLDSLSGVGCGAGRAPRPEDRLFIVALDMAPGANTAAPTIYQYVGDCSSWSYLSGGTTGFPIQIAMAEDSDRDVLGVEARVTLRSVAGTPSDALTTGLLGAGWLLQASDQSFSPPLSRHRFPFTDGLDLNIVDMSTLETLRWTTGSVPPHDNRIDAYPPKN